MKLKRDDLLKENAQLKERIGVWERKDEEIRKQLTQIIRYYAFDSYTVYQKSDTLTWLQIAFHMGELRADANYAMVLQAREDLKRELDALKNPKPN